MLNYSRYYIYFCNSNKNITTNLINNRCLFLIFKNLYRIEFSVHLQLKRIILKFILNL